MPRRHDGLLHTLQTMQGQSDCSLNQAEVGCHAGLGWYSSPSSVWHAVQPRWLPQQHLRRRSIPCAALAQLPGAGDPVPQSAPNGLLLPLLLLLLLLLLLPLQLLQQVLTCLGPALATDAQQPRTRHSMTGG